MPCFHFQLYTGYMKVLEHAVKTFCVCRETSKIIFNDLLPALCIFQLHPFPSAIVETNSREPLCFTFKNRALQFKIFAIKPDTKVRKSTKIYLSNVFLLAMFVSLNYGL